VNEKIESTESTLEHMSLTVEDIEAFEADQISGTP